MKTFRTFYQLLIFSVVLSFVSTAFAQKAPYSDWVFDLDRAQKANDAGAIAKLASDQPDLARIWFYGYVYDVVTAGVPRNEQAAIRQTSSQIASALSNLGEGNQSAQRLMERLGDDSIQPRIQTLRLEEERWENAPANVDMLPLQLSVVNDPEQAAQIFYRALFKASKWKTKLGGTDKAMRFLSIARRLASGFALAYGDFSYWKALATYQGTQTVPFQRLSFVEETVCTALNRQVTESPKAAYKSFNEAFVTISKTRQDSLLVGLFMNGLAASATLAGDISKAVSLREQLHAGVRPLQLRALNEVVYGQLIGSYIAAGKIDLALRAVEQFTKLFNPEKLRVRSIARLLQAVEVFAAESKRAQNQSLLPRAIRYSDATLALLNMLVLPAYTEAYYVNAQATSARLKHLAQAADLYKRLGSIHLLRADYAAVKTALESAQAVYRDELNRGGDALHLELDKIACIIEQGAFDDAEKALDALRKADGVGSVTRATAHSLSAQQFLLRGAYAPAFAHANEGLKILHDGKLDAKATYRALHTNAALALESAGFKTQALERWGWVDKVQSSFESSAHQARLLSALGRVDEAVEKLEPYFETDQARETTILQGCLLAGTDRHEEASASLSVLVPQLSLPSRRRFRAAGYACLAQIDAKTGNHGSALKRITSARRALESFPSNALRWKIDLLHARVLAASGQRAQAVPVYVKALAHLELNQYDSSVSGSGIFDFTGGPSLSLDAVHEEAASVALALADKSKGSIQQGLLKTAVQRIRMQRALEMSSSVNPYQRIQEELSDLSRLRVQRTKMLYLANRLETVALSQRRHAELNRAFKQAASQIDQLVEEKLKKSKSLTNPYEVRLNEQASNRISVYYLVQPKISYAVLRAGDAYRLYTLPGAERISVINQQLNGLVQATPKAWSPTKTRSVTDPNFATWKRLKDHGRTLVPFMFDGAAQGLLGKEIELFLDGDLMRTAFDALVITAPPKRQKAEKPQVPAYFSTAVSPIYLIGETQAAPSAQGQTALVYGASPLKVCHSQVTNDCVSQQAAVAVRALIEKTPAANKRPVAELSDEAASQAALVLGVPLNIVDGSVVADTSTVQLKETKGGVAEVIATLSHWDGDMTKNERGLTQMWGMLSRRGTQGVALYRGGAGDGEDGATHPISEAIARNESTIAALKTWMRDRASSVVDVREGGPAYNHPYYWKKWQVLGEPATWVKPKPAPKEPDVKAKGDGSNASTPNQKSTAPQIKAPVVEDPFTNSAAPTGSEAEVESPKTPEAQ